jgi:hypothetical protein
MCRIFQHFYLLTFIFQAPMGRRFFVAVNQTLWYTIGFNSLRSMSTNVR